MKSTLLLLLLTLSLPVFAATNTFRCGSDLIYEGDARSRVLAKCGEPNDVTHSVALRAPVVWRYGRPIYFNSGLIEIPVEVWIYNRGPNSFVRQLRFEDGMLKEIRTLGYGY
jgi:Protein of unknown function (DUF2845)